MNNSAEKVFENRGTLLFDQDDIPMEEKDWQQLEEILNTVEYEHVVGGDAGEGHSVWVCRFHNDVDRPAALHEKSVDVSNIVMSQKMKAFYKRFTGTDALCLRRCQANLLHEDDYIGVHKDQDSSPCYFATVVFHFGSQCSGGDFVTHDVKCGDKSYHPQKRSVLVNNCSIPHEVSKVLNGERKTLACFLSKDFGPSNKFGNHKRQEFRIVK
jgi:hypothetical protein